MSISHCVQATLLLLNYGPKAQESDTGNFITVYCSLLLVVGHLVLYLIHKLNFVSGM